MRTRSPAAVTPLRVCPGRPGSAAMDRRFCASASRDKAIAGSAVPVLGRTGAVRRLSTERRGSGPAPEHELGHVREHQPAAARRGTGRAGHAAARAARPQLRIVGGGLQDTVVRRKRFGEAHPEIVITPPGTQASMWTARRAGKTLASGYYLDALLDTLDWLLGKQP